MALAEIDCETVETAYLDATSMRESAEIRSLKQELLAEMDATSRWLAAVEMYMGAAANLSMASPEARDEQDAAVLVAASAAIECWNVPDEVSDEIVRQAMAVVDDSFTPEKRAERAEIAQAVLQ